MNKLLNAYKSTFAQSYFDYKNQRFLPMLYIESLYLGRMFKRQFTSMFRMYVLVWF